MARRSLHWFACAVAASLVLAAPALALNEPPAPTTPKPSFVPGQIIVVWEEDATRSEKLDAKQNAEVDSATTLGDPSFQVVEVESGQSTSDAIADLESHPAVASAERDALLAPTSIPNDPLFPQLWALENTGLGIGGFVGAEEGADIDAPDAWEQFIPPFVGLPGKGVTVADIDSGYRFEGPELGPVWVPGFDFVGSNADSPSEDSNPTDDNLVSGGHGVHTAGTIGAAGNNETGITGVAQDARIMPLRVCSASPSNSNALRCPTSSIIAAVNYAGSHGARVANISLTNTSPSFPMREAIAKNPGTLFVISSGNDGVNNDSVGHHHYPCDFQPGSEVPGATENVICVTATNQADELASFSDWGATSVDLAAPGTEILSTYPVEDVLSEDSELTNFGIRWTAGLEGGFGRTNEAPLTSFGISDSPEEAPVAGSTRESELTNAISIPGGYGNCQLSGRRFVELGSGKFTQEIIVDESEVIKSTPTSTSGSAMVSFAMPPISDLAGSSVKIRFRYEVGASPAPSNGVWLDDLQFACYQATTVAPAYAFLQGTSMAAPLVSGTAALIFSLHPGASLTAVRNALLASVDPVDSLKDKTVTGGRLDAARALAELDTTPPASPALVTDPASPSTSSTPRIFGAAEPGSTVRVYANASCAGSPMKELSAAALGSSGVPVTVPSGTTLAFSATATDAGLNVSGCSAVSYTNISSFSNGNNEMPPPPPPPPPPSCTVPRVAGKTLAKAKAALVHASCRVGKVTKPKAKPGQKPSPLVVKSSSPAAGAKPASGVVAIKLGPKPSARRH